MEQCPDNNFCIKLRTDAHFVNFANVFDIIMTYIAIAYTKDVMTYINTTMWNDILDNYSLEYYNIVFCLKLSLKSQGVVGKYNKISNYFEMVILKSMILLELIGKFHL